MSALWESVSWPTSITKLFQDTYAHETSNTDESDESDGEGQELGEGDTGSDSRNQHDHDDNINSENEAQERTNRCDEEYDGNDTHENDEDGKEGEVYSHGGHGTNEDVSEKDASRSHSVGGAISDNPAGNIEHGSGDEASDDEDDDGFYDPVHCVIRGPVALRTADLNVHELVREPRLRAQGYVVQADRATRRGREPGLALRSELREGVQGLREAVPDLCPHAARRP
ncbi:hypothetical protein HETIRDRAFT_455278 [Heterobasidion irregulare TC 32-1]|uniref:Uncharacterized protein n=1 Tax=Heterobasidion irregulare (strain TC 32-1) TaxID=747525 RepID=W4JTG1_HETIT|nr:uncharacterized protein HETIRDRAFT_455278 [Heterobasidion irregulare TC 32-1]ETW76837.1 hypothetical protein HETIRDRAFT_455278 [Heterobasidion irregulare TC 32-1]